MEHFSPYNIFDVPKKTRVVGPGGPRPSPKQLEENASAQDATPWLLGA